MKKPPIKIIDGKNVILQPFSEKFLTDNYLNWMNDKETTKFISKAKKENSMYDLELFVKHMIKSNLDYFFAIIYKKNKCHIGNVRLGPINFDTMESNFGILIGDKKFHGLGLATEVLELIKSFGFDYLKLKEIKFEVVKKHTAAMRLYAKTKFTYLGEIKKTFNKNGNSLTLVEWSMKNSNFKNNKND